MVGAGPLRLALDAETQARSVQPLIGEMVLDGITDWEYIAANGPWRANNLRPPQYSLGSFAQGTLHELSSPSAGIVMMEFPHVP